jgi:uncharacterized protein
MGPSNLFSRSKVVETFPTCSWQYVIFKELEATLTDKVRGYPCIFGVAGFARDELRYCFSENMAARDVAAALKAYLPLSRGIGRNTSLVMFSKPGPIETLEAYERRFWSLLQDLTKRDECEWPRNMPRELDHRHWEFCFSGEPIFVVCNTPAHVNRQSRRASSFVITFQPRWLFDTIMATPEVAKLSIAKVRKRLEPYDTVSPSPSLGIYGEPHAREYKQYFLDDHNHPPTCPFHQL